MVYLTGSLLFTAFYTKEEGGSEEEKEVGRKDEQKRGRDKVIVRTMTNMQCIQNGDCIRCQYDYTKQTLPIATEPIGGYR